MKTWKNYLKGMLPEAVCLCMGMIVLLQYCNYTYSNNTDQNSSFN